MFNFMRGLQQQVLKVKASNIEQSNAQLTSRVQCIYSTCTKSSHRTDPALWTNDVPVLGSTAFLAVMQITKSAKGTGGVLTSVSNKHLEQRESQFGTWVALVLAGSAVNCAPYPQLFNTSSYSAI